MTTRILTVLVLAGALAQAQNTREIRKTAALNPDGRVFVDTYKGSVSVDVWEKGEVEIVARIEADEWDRYSQENVRDTEIRIDETSAEVRIKTDYDRLRRGRHRGFWGLFDGTSGSLPFVHYTIRMPASARLRIKDYKSDISLAGLKAGIDVETYKGTVEARGVEGGMDLETYKGNIRVEFASLNSASSFETYKGDMDIVLPRTASFHLDAQLGRRGDLDSDFSLASLSDRRSKKRYSYSGDVNGGGPTLRLRTDKGNFRLLNR